MLLAAIDTVNEHYRVIIEKDIAGILHKYVPSEDTYVILEGPRLTTKGFEKISKGWKDFCLSPIQLKTIQWTEGPFRPLDGFQLYGRQTKIFPTLTDFLKTFSS